MAGIAKTEWGQSLCAHLCEVKERSADPYIRGFCPVVVKDIDGGGGLSDILHWANDLSRGRFETMEPPHAFRLLLRSVQAHAMEIDSQYPVGYYSPDRWSQLINDDILRNDTRAEDLQSTLTYMDLLSNLADRYKAFVLAARILISRGRLSVSDDHPITAYDFGCSQNHGLKKWELATWQEAWFGRVTVNRLCEGGDCAPHAVPDVTRTRNTNYLLGYPPLLGEVIGIDIQQADDPVIKRLARSCRFEPRELLRKRCVYEYDYLSNTYLPNVGFVRADYTSEEDMAALALPRADLVLNSQSLYELSGEGRELAWEQAKQRAPFSILNGFVELSPGSAFGVRHLREWPAYSCRTVLVDNKTGEAEELFRWSSGRHEQMIASDNILAELDEMAILQRSILRRRS